MDVMPMYLQSIYWKIVLPILAIALYANTIGHEYTQDDAIVIYDNMYTQQGVDGISGLLTKDTFFGFFKTEGKANLVSGGRYRPLTPVMFAIEWELFGNNPMIGHLINILLFGLLAFILFVVLDMLLNPQKTSHSLRLIAIVATLIFITHPIHTEAVANIKGRDEIMTLLLSLVALYASYKWILKLKVTYLLISGVAFFLALMSKENAITFLAIIPLALWSFLETSKTKIAISMIPALIGTIAFLIIRTSILGLDLGGTPMELMNNPYIKIEDGLYKPFSTIEKYATIMYTLGKYLVLLVFPHPLTHDYYPRYIEMMHLGNWKVILSLLTYIGLIAVMIKTWYKKSITSFSIFYFIATLSIVSNIVFPIGTNMSERFMFMPSVGFALLLAYLAVTYIYKRYGNVPFMASVGLVVVLFSLKTITRNMVWESDYTLFTTDVHTSVNSAKILNAAGGALTTEAAKEKDPERKKEMLNQAQVHLKRAIEIHPNYKSPYLLLGNSSYYLGDHMDAIKYYEKLLQIDPDSNDGINNLSVALRDAGRYFGQEKNDLPKAINYLNRSVQLNAGDYETYRLLGICYGLQGSHQNAINNFAKAIEIDPNIAQAYVNLGTAYQNSGDKVNAKIQYDKALKLDPKALNNLKQ